MFARPLAGTQICILITTYEWNQRKSLPPRLKRSREMCAECSRKQTPPLLLVCFHEINLPSNSARFRICSSIPAFPL